MGVGVYLGSCLKSFEGGCCCWVKPAWQAEASRQPRLIIVRLTPGPGAGERAIPLQAGCAVSQLVDQSLGCWLYGDVCSYCLVSARNSWSFWAQADDPDRFLFVRRHRDHVQTIQFQGERVGKKDSLSNIT